VALHDNVAVPAIDSKIDDLYRGPLSEFVSSRNALAKTLTGDDAKAVKALAKPTVVPWAVNQVYWHARAAWERVMKSGEKLRKAQIAALEGRTSDVRSATEAHRHAIADAVREAQQLSASSGSTPGTDALSRTFEALSLATEPPESPGRLTEALQPAGFEALAGVKPQLGTLHPFMPRRTEPLPKAAPSTRAGGDRADKEDARQRRAEEQRATREQEKAAAAARERQAAIKKAEAAVARAEAHEQQARSVWDKAHDALLEARRALAALRSSS
jgi:hypothetical protein